MSEPKVYFRGSYDWRKPVHVVSGVFLMVVGVAYVAGYVWMGAWPRSDEWTPMMLLLVAVGGLLPAAAPILVGVLGCIRAWQGRKWEIVVTSLGVYDGKQFHPWTELAMLKPFRVPGRFLLEIRMSRCWLHRRSLMTDPGLTREEALALMHILREEVAPAFPHLQFNDNPARW